MMSNKATPGDPQPNKEGGTPQNEHEHLIRELVTKYRAEGGNSPAFQDALSKAVQNGGDPYALMAEVRGAAKRRGLFDQIWFRFVELGLAIVALIGVVIIITQLAEARSDISDLNNRLIKTQLTLTAMPVMQSTTAPIQENTPHLANTATPVLPTATSSSTPSITSTPTATLSSTPSITSTLTATPTSIPIAPPEYVKVGNTGGEGVRLRADPKQEGQSVGVLVDGTVLLVVGSDVSAEDHIWRNVQTTQGDQLIGYIRSEYLLPADAP